MNRKIFKWISDLVRNNPDQTTTRPRSEIGHSVLEYYQCGRIQNNKLIFNAQDKRSLRSQIKTELGIDPFETHKLPDTRIEVAEFHDNEKLAKSPVSHDHVLVNSPTGILQINGQKIQLQPEFIPAAGMMCLSSGIAQIDHASIVVVENLSIMELCRSFTLPSLIQKALWVYRGDNKSGAKVDACHDLLNRYGKDKDVIVFSDMDPKGLEISLTIPYAKFWLGPKSMEWDHCLQSRFSSRSGYDEQGEAMKYLLKCLDSKNISQEIKELILRISSQRSSYRQEHMYAHNIPLTLFSLNKPQLRNC